MKSSCRLLHQRRVTVQPAGWTPIRFFSEVPKSLNFWGGDVMARAQLYLSSCSAHVIGRC